MATALTNFSSVMTSLVGIIEGNDILLTMFAGGLLGDHTGIHTPDRQRQAKEVQSQGQPSHLYLFEAVHILPLPTFITTILTQPPKPGNKKRRPRRLFLLRFRSGPGPGSPGSKQAVQTGSKA